MIRKVIVLGTQKWNNIKDCLLESDIQNRGQKKKDSKFYTVWAETILSSFSILVLFFIQLFFGHPYKIILTSDISLLSLTFFAQSIMSLFVVEIDKRRSAEGYWGEYGNIFRDLVVCICLLIISICVFVLIYLSSLKTLNCPYAKYTIGSFQILLFILSVYSAVKIKTTATLFDLSNRIIVTKIVGVFIITSIFFLFEIELISHEIPLIVGILTIIINGKYYLSKFKQNTDSP